MSVQAKITMTRNRNRGGSTMSKRNIQNRFSRRTVIKGAAAIGAMQIASPFVVKALGETPVKVGMIDPLTGVYAAYAQNEVMGAKLAIEQVNAKGGVLGRPIKLLVEESANDVG